MTDAIDNWCEAPVLNEFTQHFGPLRRRSHADRHRYALRARADHTNGAGFVHGGVITAFVDEVAGTVVAEATSRPHVTVHLATSFLRPVRIGDLLELDCDIVKTTRSMAFVEARLFVADDIAATANLIFKAMRADRAPAEG